jgi:hypothetical protein
MLVLKIDSIELQNLRLAIILFTLIWPDSSFYFLNFYLSGQFFAQKPWKSSTPTNTKFNTFVTPYIEEVKS